MNDQDDKILALMRERFKLAAEAEAELRDEALEDFRFRAGEQWDADMRQARDDDGRPCFTLNRIPQFLRQITNEQRQNRPSISVDPIGDGADKETAEVEQGVTRHIEIASDADVAYDTGFDSMATGGFGFFRITTDYTDEMSFDQEIRFERILDPFSVYSDPACQKPDYSDGRFSFVETWLDKDEFEAAYPDSDLVGFEDFSSIGDAAPGWALGSRLRVVEYFYIEKKRVWIVKASDGRSYPEADVPKGLAVLNGKDGKPARRESSVPQVKWLKSNGFEILERADWPGKFIPIVPILGDEFIVNGKRHLVGIVRYAREPQRMYNLWTSAMAESIALAPKAPWLATAEQIEPYKDLWQKANTSSLPFLPYKASANAPPPTRIFPSTDIGAITQAIAHADNDLKNTTGLYDPSLGAPGPEQSGKAILLRQKQGDQANFNFIDNMSRAIRHAGRIVIDLIPKIYDVARVVRIVNPDGSQEQVPINQAHITDGVQKIFDLTTGRYDVSVSTGPSYQSRRAEAAQSIMALVASYPPLMQFAGDLMIREMDWPLSEQIADRMKKMLPPQLAEPEDAQAPTPQQMHQMAAQNDQLQKAIHGLVQEKQGRLLEIQSKEKIAAWSTQAQLVIALTKVNSADAQARADRESDMLQAQFAAAHEAGLAGMDQSHSLEQSAQQHAQTLQQQGQQQQAAQQAAAQPDPAAGAPPVAA